jgi:hypothetical protein
MNEVIYSHSLLSIVYLLGLNTRTKAAYCNFVHGQGPNTVHSSTVMTFNFKY